VAQVPFGQRTERAGPLGARFDFLQGFFWHALAWPHRRSFGAAPAQSQGAVLPGRPKNPTLIGMPAMSAELEAYLKAWERHLTLPDGTRVHVRPLRPEDEALYGPFFKAETADDLRLRFFGPVKVFDHAFFSRFTNI